MSSSWDHAVTRLDPETVDEHDRWGRRCSTRRCAEPVTHQTSYRYVTGRAGRITLAEHQVCDGHAARFAQRHLIEIGPAPARVEPRLADAQLPAAHRAELRRTRYHPVGHWWLSLARAGGGEFASWTVPEFAVPSAAGLEEAIRTAEAFLAGRMLVPKLGWHRAGERATATLVPVTDTPPWRGISWVFTVACGPDALGTPTWYLERQLSTEFDTLRYPLGNTGMDLDRAARTAERYLERTGWTLAGQWTSSGQVAIVHAQAPAWPAVSRPASAPVAAATATSRVARPPAGRRPTPLPAAVR
jgi:hypothetical protein